MWKCCSPNTVAFSKRETRSRCAGCAPLCHPRGLCVVNYQSHITMNTLLYRTPFDQHRDVSSVSGMTGLFLPHICHRISQHLINTRSPEVLFCKSSHPTVESEFDTSGMFE